MPVAAPLAAAVVASLDRSIFAELPFFLPNDIPQLLAKLAKVVVAEVAAFDIVLCRDPSGVVEPDEPGRSERYELVLRL